MNLDLDYLPVLGNKRDYGIGIIGAGGIVNAAHLPAYRKAGFNVIGLTDQDRDKAEQTARSFEVPTVYASVEALLGDQSVEIVDIAVPPWNQKDLVRQVTAAGKHLLCQKPLSNIYAEAVEIVEMAEASGVKLAVNQQMRWDQAVRASRSLLNRGLLGDPASAVIDISILTEWRAWPWVLTVEGLDLMFHSIHYFDSMRSLFGLPERVWTSGFRLSRPGAGWRNADDHGVRVLRHLPRHGVPSITTTGRRSSSRRCASTVRKDTRQAPSACCTTIPTAGRTPCPIRAERSIPTRPSITGSKNGGYPTPSSARWAI